jgi:methylmalonyl-CoA epimerase
MSAELEQVPGFLFFDHVAISVRPGELEAHVQAYQAMGFKEMHREDVLGGDQVREVLLQVGEGPNLVQLLEPLTPESPVAKQIEKNGGRGGMAHVALRVADIQKAFDYLKEHASGIDKVPRSAAGTTFLHPKTTETAAFGYCSKSCRGCSADADAGTEVLNLEAGLPPVSTETWEAAVARSQGGDYEKNWYGGRRKATIRPYYRQEALAVGRPADRSRCPFDWWGVVGSPNTPGPRAVRADLLHEAGAHAVQELGYGIAAGVERLVELTASLPVDTVAPGIEFVFAVGPAYFVEIAKLRAARMLWAQAVSAFGPRDDGACRMRLHVRTPSAARVA